MSIKKTGAVLLALCVLLCCLVPAFAAEPEVKKLPGANVGYTFDSESGTMTIVLTGGAKSGRIGDNPGDGAMIFEADAVKTVQIAPWITAIGSRAFAGFDSLETVWIPKTVKEIGAGAFAGCGQLTVHYSGTEEEWGEIEFGEDNDWVKTAFMIFGSFDDDPGDPDVEPTVEPKPDNLCPWCNTVHGDGFFQRIVAWFHSILAKIIRK